MTSPPSKLVPLSSLFSIEHGNKFDLNKMEVCRPADNAVAFVGRSGNANGIVAFVKRRAQTEPYEAGLITVALGGAALSSFVQPRQFYTGQKIDVLRSITDMSLDAKLYYCLCVKANAFRYSTFGREANRTLHEILVPELESLPEWVENATAMAVEDLRKDLSAVAKGQ